jgi:bacterioferritin
MKGKQTVIDSLNRLLTGELTSADQYFAHSRMYENWGFTRLYQRIEHERQDELEHAARLIQRILFLEGVPDVASRRPLTLGATVPEMLRNDLAYELAVVAELKEVIALAEREQDYQTRDILRDLLAETEQDHVYWLEQQVNLITHLGLPNYLQTAAGDIATSQG